MKAALTFVFTILIFFNLYSHPHMFITSETTLVFSAEKLEGFFIEWTFDDMFSGTIIDEYDKNRDGSFSTKETAIVKKNAFDYVSESKYFIEMKINGQEKTVKKVSRFTAKVKNHKLVYRFFVPLDLPCTKNENEVRFTVFDDTFYIDFQMKEPETEPNAAVIHSVKTLNHAKETDFYGQRPAKEIIIKFRKK